MTAAFEEGIRLFNSRKYFEAHEALEAVWLKACGKEKIFLHGLIQIAAAFHHYTRKNLAGFSSLLKKGCEKFRDFGEARGGIDLAGLLVQLQPWCDWLSRGVAVPAAPPLPRIERATTPRRAR
jgi:uncharacterized protein